MPSSTIGSFFDDFWLKAKKELPRKNAKKNSETEKKLFLLMMG